MNILNKILNIKNRQHLTLWGVVLLLFVSGNLNAQKGFSLTGGLGIYELANVGVQWNCSQISSFSAFAGTAIGAIAGEAGRGAAIGAVVGGLRGRMAKVVGDAKEKELMSNFSKAFTACMVVKGYTV